MVAVRQPKPTGIAALLLERGVGFLYCFATLVILEEAVVGLKAENEHLAGEIIQIKESKAYARKVLREKYHVTDENEKIIYYAD